MNITRKLKNSLHYLFALYGSLRYGNPSNELFVIGVTGTSGKSTTIYLLRQMLEALGYKVGALSTIDFYVAGEDKLNDKKMTMLGRAEIHAYLRKMVDHGCDIAIVETTSEGYLQHRHKFINYDTFIFTNLYPEHIESHGSFENYKNAKLGILRYAAQGKKKKRRASDSPVSIYTQDFSKDIEVETIPKTLIAPLNNEHVEDVIDTGFDAYYTFGRNDQVVYLSLKHIKESADAAFANHAQVVPGGLAITFDKRSVIVPMYGEHNAQNVLAVCALARSLGAPWHEIFDSMVTFRNVPGRIEFIPEAKEKGFNVIVDYAFEPVAMQGLYTVAKSLQPKRIIHVCSATGGGRDTSRRLPIGRMAGAEADIVIVTDEDPYDEDPMKIIEDVTEGAKAAGKTLNKDLYTMLDRKEAITFAVSLAQAGDLILVTGKGSEQGMMVAGGKMIPWDDREIVREALRERA